MCNRTKSNLSIKKYRVTLLQQFSWMLATWIWWKKLMFVKWYDKKYVSFFTIWTVQSAVTCESGRAESLKSARKSFYFGISKLILYFPNFIYRLLYVLFTVLFYSKISVFRTSIYAFFVINLTWKQTLWMKLFNFVFTKDLPSISQSNVQAGEAENEE